MENDAIPSGAYSDIPAHRVLQVLSELSHRTGDLDGYLKAIVLGMSDLLSLDWSVVTLMCDRNQERILASSIDIGAAMDEVYPLHGTVTQTVVQQGCPLTVADTTLDSSQGAVEEGYRAYLGVPLKLPNGDVLGTICSFQSLPRHFTQDEVKLAELFAERAAIAIDNFQLFEQQQQLNQALQTEIKERKAVEAALRVSEQRFRTLVEQATDAFYIVNRNGQIRDINQRACHQLGYTRDAFLRMSVSDIQVGQTPQEIESLLQLAQSGQPVTVEGIHRRQDGSTFPVEVNVNQIELSGEPIYLALVRDISDRKRAERDRERLAEIGELASMVVHEVRNPLTTVWMALTAMQKEPLPERSRNRLAYAVEEAQRLQGLLNDILLYAKPAQLVESQTVDLKAFITTLIESLSKQPALSTRQILWQPPKQLIWLNADIDKLKQVFINLITNACEAVEAGGSIKCWAEQSNPCQVLIHVENGGKPIPPEVLPRLTQPFFTTKSSGNGLGLAITKRIVEAHDGQLQITSNADQGTRVSVALPCKV